MFRLEYFYGDEKTVALKQQKGLISGTDIHSDIESLQCTLIEMEKCMATLKDPDTKYLLDNASTIDGIINNRFSESVHRQWIEYTRDKDITSYDRLWATHSRSNSDSHGPILPAPYMD